MADEIAAVGTTAAGRMWATILGFILCVFGMIVIALVTWKGEPANTLHTNAQAWAFALCMGVGSSLGLAQLASLWAPKR